MTAHVSPTALALSAAPIAALIAAPIAAPIAALPGPGAPVASERSATPAVLPGPARFAGVVELIRSVFQVPAVSIALHGAPDEGECGVYRSFLETPLLQDGVAIGALRILDTAERDFGERDCLLLEGFARLVVEQVELWSEASRDMLTGAMTRRAFHEALRKRFAAQQRQRGQAALILFDLDHFKRVNDSLGHAAGDTVLRATARAVLGELRLEDSFGRIGGEEFAVLVNGADAAIAQEVAERIRAGIARMTVPGQPGLAVTASFGVVALTDATPSAEALVEAADAALYAAKSGGRNRVELARAPAPALVC